MVREVVPPRLARDDHHGPAQPDLLSPVDGILLGELVDEGDADLGGLSYLEFVAPGLIAALAMQIGTNEGSFPVMAGIRWARTYHAVVATPVRVRELYSGLLSWTAARIFTAAALFACVAAVAGAFLSPLAVLTPVAAVFCGLAFAAPMAALAGGMENHAALTAIFRFALLPIFLFSGTFFPIDNLPDWLRADRLGNAAVARRLTLSRSGDRRDRGAGDARPRRLPARVHTRRLRARRSARSRESCSREHGRCTSASGASPSGARSPDASSTATSSSAAAAGCSSCPASSSPCSSSSGLAWASARSSVM